MVRRFSLPLAVAVALVGGGVAAWWWGTRGPGDEVPAADDPVPVAGPTVEPAATRPMAPPPDAPTAAPVEVEAVATPGEVLPPIRVGDRPRVARFRPEVFRDGMELKGEVFLRGIVEAREVWVRWDSAATRERFLAGRFPVPGMQVLESGEAVVILEPVADLLRHFGFSARWDGATLRVGAEGVYPAEPPRPADGDRPPEAPSPR